MTHALARQHLTIATLATRCSWCGKHVEVPADPWGIRKYEPVFCCGQCLTSYREQLKGGPF